MNKKTLTVVIVLVVVALLGFYVVNNSNENSSRTTEVVKDTDKEKKADKENKVKEEKTKSSTDEKLNVYIDDGAIHSKLSFSENRELTKEELNDFNMAFGIYTNSSESNEEPEINVICHMFSSYYDKPENINIVDMVYYMKRDFDIDEKEFEALKKLDSFVYKDAKKLEDTVTPVGRIPKENVAKLFYNSTGVDFEKALSNSKANDKSMKLVVYLDEPYNSFYSMSSDFGVVNFAAKSGNYKDGVIALYSDKSKLVLRQEGDRLYIVSHTKK